MFSEALSFPRRGDHSTKTLIIGGGIQLLAVIFAFIPGLSLLPGIFLNGYYLRVLDVSQRDSETEVPEFDNWKEIFIDGLKFMVVGIIWFIPIMVLMFLAIPIIGFGALSASSVDSNVGAILGGSAAIGLVLLILLVGLGIGYILPASMALLARNREISDAFDFTLLKQILLSSDYFVAVLIAFGVLIVGGILGGLLAIILVGFVILFYTYVMVFYLIGQGVSNALEEENMGTI